MKNNRLLWMFFAVFSGGMGVSKAWDLVSGKITDKLALHIALLVLLIGVSIYFFKAYFAADKQRQADRQRRK